jgi:hypothetical protein
MRTYAIARLGQESPVPGVSFIPLLQQRTLTISIDTKAADKNPTVGRLYHHLAILARPNALQQLYYYSRSLTCVKPFPSARESILTLLEPILGRGVATYSHAPPIDNNYTKAHALLFEKLSLDEFNQAKLEFTDSLNMLPSRTTLLGIGPILLGRMFHNLRFHSIDVMCLRTPHVYNPVYLLCRTINTVLICSC